MFQTVRGKVNLGRVHIKCGDMIVLDADTDVQQLGVNISRSLQANTATTMSHLRTFVQQQGAMAADLDVDWIRNQIEERGGTVLEDNTAQDSRQGIAQNGVISPQYCWEHLFFNDLRASQLYYPALEAYITLHDFQSACLWATSPVQDDKLITLLKCMFCHDYDKGGITITEAKDESVRVS